MVRLAVISSCTGRKAHLPPDHLTMEDLRSTPEELNRRKTELADWALPAIQMYRGEQHLQVVRGLETLRAASGSDSIRLYIVSAGYGLLDEDEMVVPYEASFSSMTRSASLMWSRRLGIAQALRDVIVGVPLAVFLLGSRYLDAIEPPVLTQRGQRLVFLSGDREEGRLVSRGVTVVRASVPEARSYRSGLIALKGRMFYLFCLALVTYGSLVWDAVMRDNSPASFVQALEEGLALG